MIDLTMNNTNVFSAIDTGRDIGRDNGNENDRGCNNDNTRDCDNDNFDNDDGLGHGGGEDLDDGNKIWHWHKFQYMFQ